MTGRAPQDEFTDFVGRQDELAQLAAMLERGRLVTVVGPGGVGKTRVSLVAAAQAAGNYPDGVWIVEQSGLRDPLLLPNTVASVLGLPEQDAGRSALDALLEYLRDKRLLLILDTCEHLLDSCADLIQAILPEAPGVTVLATSRQPLDTLGEQNFTVQPLPVPDSDTVALDRGDAVELFALRAAAAVPDFTVTPANAADVIGLCRRLDGIPLAIELAAVQLRSLALDELTKRLDHRFAVLTGGRPGALERHQTLHTAIEWSFGLCSLAERRLWMRMSVFAGTFSLAAVEEVCAEVELERGEVVNALIGLVDKSVVVREGSRYRMLDTLREFGAERLAESGEEAACRARHIGRYLAKARYFGDHFADDDQMERYHELRETHSNVRAALEYALGDAGGATGAAARWRSGLELACALYGYWQISGLLGEGGYWLTKALERFPAAGRERALALVNRGFVRSFHGDIEGALADCEQGTEIALAIGDDAIVARGYQHLHLTLTFLGRHDEALKVGAEARERLRACGDRAGEVIFMGQQGHLHHLAGRPLESVATCEEGLAMLGPGAGEQWLRSYLYLIYGLALYQMPGREAACEEVVRQGLLGKSKLGDIVGMAYALSILGWVSLKVGLPERAAWLLGTAAPLWDRSSAPFSGTAIMEQFHLDAERDAAAAIGAERYAAVHGTGVAYMKGQLNDVARGASFQVQIP
ncbi:MAG TPA: NB-ARC domain-containing protein [Trebonia sp.]|nr:NB-ARC domain-containing protein [Trebonia sp.]